MEQTYAPTAFAADRRLPIYGKWPRLSRRDALASAAGIFPVVGMVLLGMGLGTEIDLIAFLITRYFGQRAFGQIYGYFFMIFGLGSGVGPLLGGVTYDRAGSYNPALIGAAFP